MTFKFQPVPEAELSTGGGYKDLKPGSATFKIVEATDRDKDGQPLVSRNGNYMLKIACRVTDSENNSGTLYDYIHDKVPWKINQLLKSVDRSVWYTSGSINPYELKGLFGQCVIKEEVTNFGKSMKISYYVERERAEIVNMQDESCDLGDIPF
jgi:hypothetical protein